MVQAPVQTSAALPILWRSNADPVAWETARVGRVFNVRRPDRQPLAIVEATSVMHIIEALKIANVLNARVSVRSGGHSWAAWSVRDDAVLIDLGGLREIDLNEEARIVKASPCTTGKMLNSLLNGRGYMFGGGHCPDVGLGGFLLQGGMGWNCRNWGWACERMVAIDVVTAKGEILHCDSETKLRSSLDGSWSWSRFPAIVTALYFQFA